ncbi:MAG: aminotransferase class V-fold PLP-dependent enzyme [Candidatus Spechtbacterales bacterium]
MIHISLSPNVQKDDVFAAISRLVMFWKWNENKYTEKLKKRFAEYFGRENTYLTNSGRSALYLFLKSLGLQEEDEIIIQAFTCNAVANPIIWAGAKPVYADINNSYNIDPAKLEEKITPNTKAVIIQNTFGIPANINEILAIARQNDLLVIEDCAHSLGATYRGRAIGTFGDVAFFSFGRDKVISSVYGGVLVVNNPDLNEKVADEYAQIKTPSAFWAFQQLFHVPATYLALLTYKSVGKYILWALQKLKLLSLAVTHEERNGDMPRYFPARLPEPLAYLVLRQFNKLEKMNRHRKELAKIYENALKDNSDFKIVENYDEGAVFLRYPVQHRNAESIIKKAKDKGIILGNWYREIIAPVGTDTDKMNYKAGSCPNAEGFANDVINLPTNIRTSARDAKKIVGFLIK